LNLHVLADTSS